MSLYKCVLSAVLASAALVTPAVAQAPAEPRGNPPLIVTLVIDQFSANLFNQYRPQFTGGLATLAATGRVHVNGFQQHGVTETCPGHSTVATGRNPSGTGIPANDWISPVTGQEVYCLAEPRNHLAHGDDTSDNGPVGTTQLMATTLADWLKDASPQSRVFAVSGKDRGAINLNGHKGDGAYWFTGDFGLTTYVEPGQTAADRLAPVAAFNAVFQQAAEAMGEGDTETPQTWTGAYAQCNALAGDWTIRGQAFRSEVPPENPEFDTSPLLDEATLHAASMLLESQQLGRRGVTDMLGVSLSATDRIGHRYGTQGPEMCEQMIRLDAALGEFLEQLPDGTLLVLTADHGGSDFVERTAVRGYPHAHRLDADRISTINAELRSRFNLDYNPMAGGGSGMIIGDRDHKALPDPLRTEIVNAAVELLRANPDVAFAENRDVLMAEPLPAADLSPDLLTLRQRMRLSTYDAQRSPDIILALAEQVVGGGRVGATIAGHGTPWDYDRRVPIIFWTPEMQGQERFLPIRTIDIAPTLAATMGLTPPSEVDGRCIDLGLEGVPTCRTP